MADRRAEAFAVLDEWESSYLPPDGEPGTTFQLRIIAALRSVLERHHFDEFRGVCDGCHWSPCPDETAVIDALLGPDDPEDDLPTVDEALRLGWTV